MTPSTSYSTEICCFCNYRRQYPKPNKRAHSSTHLPLDLSLLSLYAHGSGELVQILNSFFFGAVRRVAFDQLYGAWHVKVISWSKIGCIRANIDNMMTFTPLVTIWMFIFYSSNFLFPESINVVKLWLVPLIGKSLFRQFSNLLNICTVHVHLAYICFVNRARFFAY